MFEFRRKCSSTFGDVISKVHDCTRYKASRIEVLRQILNSLFWRRGVCNTSKFIRLFLELGEKGVSVEKQKHKVTRPHIDRVVNQGEQPLYSGDQISFELSLMDEMWPPAYNYQENEL